MKNWLLKMPLVAVQKQRAQKKWAAVWQIAGGKYACSPNLQFYTQHQSSVRSHSTFACMWECFPQLARRDLPCHCISLDALQFQSTIGQQHLQKTQQCSVIQRLPSSQVAKSDQQKLTALLLQMYSKIPTSKSRYIIYLFTTPYVTKRTSCLQNKI